MAVTLPLDEELVREAEAYAARTWSDLRTLVAGSLRARITQEATIPEEKRCLKIPSQPMRPKPGIDLSNNAKVRDIMDASEGRPSELSGQE